MDLPRWTLLCSLESLPTIFGNHLLSCRAQFVSLGWSISWICSTPYPWKACQSESSGQPYTLAGEEELKNEDMLSFSNQVSFLAAFAVVYGLYDLRCGDQTTLFMATAYNAFQVEAFSFLLSFLEAGLEFGSFLGHLCVHKGTKSPCSPLTYDVMSGLRGSGQ